MSLIRDFNLRAALRKEESLGRLGQQHEPINAGNIGIALQSLNELAIQPAAPMLRSNYQRASYSTGLGHLRNKFSGGDPKRALITVFFAGSWVFFGYHAATDWFSRSRRVFHSRRRFA